ncbi:NapC/NirT family cytochrome c [Azospirillum sp.]|uniref:NapC/NirT family cytochrome c n=1 Tax=Azospirillum sp. TaxID=34012 RepID=UPI003D74703B
MTTETIAGRRPGALRRLWTTLWRPSARYSLAGLLLVGVVAGVVFWGGFNWAMEMTNREEFCVSCHEMKNNVYAEYTGSIHDSNRTGVRATCPDCHVPKEWIHKVVRKIQASNEVLHWALGSINTREKFEEQRPRLANNVWTAMKNTDSRECRNCHNFQTMDVTQQRSRARDRHLNGALQGQTCIDCHKGIAHQLPAGALQAEQKLNETFAKH